MTSEGMSLRDKVARIISCTKVGGKDDSCLGDFVAYAAMTPVKWNDKNFTVPADAILRLVAEEVKRMPLLDSPNRGHYFLMGYAQGRETAYANIAALLRKGGKE